jgi:uncharacterized protein YndB with AHSA1/START domain
MSELVMEWRVAHPIEQVFEAIEDPFRMRRWYGAPADGFRLGQEGDMAVGGGLFRLNLLDAKGAPRVQTGRILAVQPGKKLWLELTWDGGDFGHETTRAALTFHPADGGTRIEVHQGPFSSPEVQEAHRAYWEANLGRLARVVSGEAVPCFEEFWEESAGYVDPLGFASHAVLAGLREAGAAPDTIASVEATLYEHLARLPEDTARLLGAVLRARLEGSRSTGG